MARLVADIGGTNARFALADRETGALTPLINLLCSDYPSIGDAVEAAMAHTQSAIDQICLAVAAGVNDQVVDLTNNHWCFDKNQLFMKLPIDELLIINDFTAQALAQNDPSAHGNVKIIDGASQDHAPLAVLGPGTGLGVSALFGSGLKQTAIEGQGGHASFSPVGDVEEELCAFLRAELGHVTIENVICGSGLQNIYRFVCHATNDDNHLTPAEIGANGVKEPGPCRDACIIFLDCLGTVIADVVLTFGCWRGAVISGGIVPKLQPLIDKSSLAARVKRIEMATRLPNGLAVWLCTDSQAGLRGAAAALENAGLQDRIIRK